MKKTALAIFASLLFIIDPTAHAPLKRAQFSSLYQNDLTKSHAPTEILLQGFTWNAKVNNQEGLWYTHLLSKAEHLKRIGITHVWLPPVSRSVSPQGYMPGDYYDLGTLENKTFYGSLEELKEALSAFRQMGITPIADVVINHRTASHKEDGIWNVFHHSSGEMMWEKWALAKDDYGGIGSPDTGENFEPAPDIDHANTIVQKDIIKWLKWLVHEIGFEGFRFDYVKGYHGSFVKKYLEATTPKFAVGEYWSSMDYTDQFVLKPDQNGHRQEIINWVDSAGGIPHTFDFTTKGILQEALLRKELWRLKDPQNRASGVLGWWPTRAVTFLDNHDTGSEQAHWPFPQKHLLAGYAYILTHPGTPCLFWDHLYDQTPEIVTQIEEMAMLRHEQGIHAGSRLKIIKASSDQYRATVDDQIYLILGEISSEPSLPWKEKVRGLDFAIFTR